MPSTRLPKVPHIAALFWVIKILTTAMGETTSDYLVFHIDPFVAVALGAVLFAASLVAQFRARSYSAWTYWFAVAMVSVFGTMAADVLHVVLLVPYAVSSAFYGVLLAAVLVLWYRSERTLSIHSIVTRRRETFYWLTVFITFALGTAVGDLTAATLGLGYLLSGVLFAAAIAIPWIGYAAFRWDEVASFWFAYILTRPLGASFADWFGKPRSWSGLGWGDGPVSLALAIAIVGLVWYVAATRRDAPERDVSRALRPESAA